MNVKNTILNKHTVTVFILSIFILSFILLRMIQAASPMARIESEDGSLSSGTTVITDLNASNGKAVRFDSQGPVTSDQLSWAPPGYPDYIGYEVINLTQENKRLATELADGKDYIINLPSYPLEGTLSINGGRNVVIIGGEIKVPTLVEAGGLWFEKQGTIQRFGIKLGNWSGVMHIEGVKFTGENDDVIRFGNDSPNATLQVQNIWIEKTIGWNKSNDGSQGPHADIIQTWCGPANELRVDGITAKNISYQGFFLPATQLCTGGKTNKTTIRNVQFEYMDDNPYGNGTETGYYAWSGDEYTDELIVDNVWMLPSPGKQGSRDNYLWPKPSGDPSDRWKNVIQNSPGTDLVPESSVGVNYESPGYN